MKPQDMARFGDAFQPHLLRRQAGLADWLIDKLTAPAFRLLRALPFILRRPCVIVSRSEDVREVLADHRGFQVRFGDRTRELDSTLAEFGMGTDRDDAYRASLRQVMPALRLEDAPWVGDIAKRVAREAVAAAGDTMDLAREVAIGVPVAVCRGYIGLAVDDPGVFGLWPLAMGNYAFATQTQASDAYRVAAAGAGCIAEVMLRSIAEARMGGAGDTVLARMLGAGVEERIVRTTLTGLITGLVPATAMAVSNVSRVLMDRPEAMTAARDAAMAEDDALLGRCLVEALRFKPIFPGPFRTCSGDRVIAAGTARAAHVKDGAVVLAATQSAMRDGRAVRNPGRFDPSRPATDTMVFGHGRHWCVAAAVALAHVTQAMKPILLRGRFRPAGRISYFGAFPEHLPITFEA